MSLKSISNDPKMLSYLEAPQNNKWDYNSNIELNNIGTQAQVIHERLDRIKWQSLARQALDLLQQKEVLNLKEDQTNGNPQVNQLFENLTIGSLMESQKKMEAEYKSLLQSKLELERSLLFTLSISKNLQNQIDTLRDENKHSTIGTNNKDYINTSPSDGSLAQVYQDFEIKELHPLLSLINQYQQVIDVIKPQDEATESIFNKIYKHHVDTENEQEENKIRFIDQLPKGILIPNSHHYPIQGDKIDELLSIILNTRHTLVPFTYIGPGTYLYGHKLIELYITQNETLFVKMNNQTYDLPNFLEEFEESERNHLDGLQNQLIDTYKSTLNERSYNELKAKLYDKDHINRDDYQNFKQQNSPSIKYVRAYSLDPQAPIENYEMVNFIEIHPSSDSSFIQPIISSSLADHLGIKLSPLQRSLADQFFTYKTPYKKWTKLPEFKHQDKYSTSQFLTMKKDYMNFNSNISFLSSEESWRSYVPPLVHKGNQEAPSSNAVNRIILPPWDLYTYIPPEDFIPSKLDLPYFH